jgi:hypothetical protein
MPTAIQAALSDALDAQLTGSGTAVHWLAMTSPSTDLRAAIAQGKPAAATHHAAGVFWLDSSSADDWLLYLMDASGERILARRMEGAAQALSAAVEAIAVIVRESARALLAGQPIEMEPVAEITPPAAAAPTQPAPSAVPEPAPSAPAPAPTEAPAETVAGPIRAGIAYVGGPLSRSVWWQHGLALQLGLMLRSGLYMQLSYALLPPTEVTQGAFGMSVQRHPTRLGIGYRAHVGGGLRLDAEAQAVVDPTQRHTLATPNTSAGTPDDTAWIFGASAQGRLTLVVQARVELFLGLGLDVFFNRFDYVRRQDDTLVTLLSPWRLAPLAELGVAFRP